MTDFERKLVCEVLAGWAHTHPEISRAIVYGSRARGDSRPDSDIDVAVELDGGNLDESLLAIWITSAGQWREELQPLLPWSLDLQWHDLAGETPTVSAKLERGHFVAYERSTTTAPESVNPTHAYAAPRNRRSRG